MVRLLATIIFGIFNRGRVEALIEILFRKLSVNSPGGGINDLGFKLYCAEEDGKRISASKATLIPAIYSFDQKDKLQVQIMNRNSPWKKLAVPPSHTPGMISNEEMQYYLYIGKFYTGAGQLVELGPWLGKSTGYIYEGLKDNPNFKGKKIQVYDDFVWRAHWMNLYVEDDEKLAEHSDFLPLYKKYTAAFSQYIETEKVKIVPYDGNEGLPDLSWNKGKIELMYVDCGRTFDVNSAWYKLLSPFFIRDKTLLILQDWRQHRETPPKWYNQIKQFTDSLGSELTEVHEITDGGIGTFLYRGK